MDTLRERVKKFKNAGLPGQSLEMNVFVVFLVLDLETRIIELEAKKQEREDLLNRLMAEEVTNG